MTDINNIVVVGRLVRDSELKYTNGGMAICKFSIAVNRSVKKGDTWEDEANFFDVTLFGKRAEGVNQYLTKGQQVAVNGELRQERWEKDGQVRSKVEIVANNIQLVGGKRDGQESSQRAQESKPATTVAADDGFTDDISF